MVIRFFKRIRLSRGAKRNTMPTTVMETMTHVPLTTNIVVAMSTLGNVENTTEVPVTMETTVGKSILSSDMELLTLTETMGLVAGIVGFIVVMVIMCFVYRSSANASVRMRKSADRDRRSTATSMEMLELNEYDQRIRNVPGLPHASTVNSPLYNRGLDNNDGSGPTQSIPIPGRSGGGFHGVENDDDSYHPNVVLNGGTTKYPRIQDDMDSDINANDVLNRNISTFKVESLNATVDKRVCSSNKEKDNEENAACSSDEAHARKRKMIETESAFIEDLPEVDSPPPTPCYSRPYVNIDSAYANEEECSKQGYINVDYRINSIPLDELEEELCDRGKETKRPKGKTRKRDKSKAKQNVALIKHDGVKSKRSPANAPRDKRDKCRKTSDHKVNWTPGNKPAKSVTLEGVEEQVYLPMTVQDDTDTSYVPMDFPNNPDTHYRPMDPMDDTDTQYLPMDNGTVPSKGVSDNVYINIENEDHKGDYINCSTTSRVHVYENT